MKLDIKTWRLAEDAIEAELKQKYNDIPENPKAKWTFFRAADGFELVKIMEEHTGIKSDNFFIAIKDDFSRCRVFINTDHHPKDQYPYWESKWEALPLGYEFPDQIIVIGKQRNKRVHKLIDIQRPLIQDFEYKDAVIYRYSEDTLAFGNSYLFGIRPMDPEFKIYQNWEQVEEDQWMTYEEVLNHEP